MKHNGAMNRNVSKKKQEPNNSKEGREGTMQRQRDTMQQTTGFT
jgi:hypothetical protein